MKRLAPLLVLVLSATACASYAPKPLDEQKLLDELRAVHVEEPADGLGPDDSVALALRGNPELRAFRQQRAVAEGQVVSASAWKNPELHLDLQNPLRFGFGLRFFPPLPGERAAKIAEAGAHEREIFDEIEDHENRLAAETRIAHARVIMLDEKLRLLDASMSLRGRLIELVERRFAASAATALDRSLAVLDRIELENERDTTQLQRDEALAELAGDLGVPPDSIHRLRSGKAPAGTTQPLEASLEQAALKQRPDLRAIKWEYEKREQELHLVYLEKVPWPRYLQPGVKKIPDKVTIDLSVALPLPIFDDKGPILEAEAHRELARAQYLARLALIRSEIRGALARVAAEDRRRRALRDEIEPALAAAEKVIEVSLASGDIDAFKLGIVEERVLKARRAAVEVEFAYARAVIQLELASGAILQAKDRRAEPPKDEARK